MRIRRDWLEQWIINGHSVYAIMLLLSLLWLAFACMCGDNNPCHLLDELGFTLKPLRH